MTRPDSQWPPNFELHPWLSSVKVGSMAAPVGLITGGIVGVLRNKHPMIHSLSMGIYTFTWGTSFWGNILNIHYQGNATPNQRAYVSGLSSGLTGAIVAKLCGIRFPLKMVDG
ncbi:hypothetical protein EYZ11_010512 [Aspergillus tanneri]|uniref:Uncharacterized protein n=1 Tax=Aspergillus tanneri TaxID=1220188 RepID=A0A4S3J5H1_9EURO|nr:hypothetical protein EYZ11_010512 [Aspergillus tanneri]